MMFEKPPEKGLSLANPDVRKYTMKPMEVCCVYEFWMSKRKHYPRGCKKNNACK